MTSNERAGPHLRELVADLTAALEAEATPGRAEANKVYFKSDLDFVGATVPAVRRATKALHRQHRHLPHDDLVRLVEALWNRGVHELRMAALVLLGLNRDLLTPADLTWLQHLASESATWVLVDELSISVLAPLVSRFPNEAHTELAHWARHDDFWVRRASILAYLPDLRRGQGDFDHFASLADLLLDEREFFIRKAIGWVLREVGKRDPYTVVEWLEPRLGRASGLTVREAVKYLPEPERERLRGRPPTP